MVKQCYIPESIELARTAKEDHRVVVALLLITGRLEPQGKRFDRRKGFFDTNGLKNEWLCSQFQQLMWKFRPSQCASITDHAEEFAQFIRNTARRVFGPAKKQPIKPWVSQRTWAILQHIGPVRRFMHSARHQTSVVFLAMYLHAWAALLPETFPMRTHMLTQRGAGTIVTYGFGWCAIARYAIARGCRQTWRCLEASAYGAIVLLQKNISQYIREDRRLYYDHLAIQAQTAATHGDLRGTYVIVKKLTGAPVKPPKAVRLLDGTVSTSTQDRCNRWQQHFMQVAGGRLVETLRELESSSASCVNENFIVTPSRILASNMRLGRNKGLGRDGISAELLCAGGSPLAVKQAEICQRIVDQESWAAQWKGGRQLDLYKGKGDTLEPDNSRGLLISDHMAKSFTTVLKEEIDESYTEFMPPSQHGAVEGLSTDFAHHFLLSCIDYAASMKLCIFVLFVDLTKAYDKVLRELVFGWPSNVNADRASRIAYLIDCGATEDVAAWIYEYLEEHGTAFEQMRVKTKIISVVRELHTNSWFQYEGCDTHVATTTGGRQGCKLGGIVFNSAYALVLIALRSKLQSLGITLRVKRRDGPFWSSHAPFQEEPDEVVDVAFVDDLCVILFASSPKKMWEATNALLQVVTELFKSFRLLINWNKGKTEAFMKFRGKHAAAYYDKLKTESGYGILVPGTEQLLHVVSTYKHLGSVTDADGCSFLYARQRASSAMASFCPLASRIFGNKLLDEWLRKSFCESLILSKLLFNAHLRVFKTKELRVLNALYMRVVRRIGDNVRFDHTACSDVKARQQVEMLSLDCILLHRRLIYLARLVRSRCHPLLALLSQTTSHDDSAMRPLPWIDQVRKDLRTCHKLSCIAASIMPDPDQRPDVWYELMASDSDTWRSMVLAIRFFGSACDKSRAIAPECAVVSFQCMLCDASFATSKALQQHARVKHGAFTNRRQYAPADGVCQCCKVRFSTRLRLIAHWSDSRRPRCWSWILANADPLPDAVVAELDATDRDLRKEARSGGHSRPLSTARPTPCD